MTDREAKTTLLVPAKEAARMLAVSPRKLWSMTASGEICHIRLGRCVRYPVVELQRWINDRKQGGNV